MFTLRHSLWGPSHHAKTARAMSCGCAGQPSSGQVSRWYLELSACFRGYHLGCQRAVECTTPGKAALAKEWFWADYFWETMDTGAKECSNYCTMALTSHASKVMLRILQARLQQYANWELPDVKAGFRKSRGTRDQIVNISWIIETAREFQNNIYFCFIDYTKDCDYVDHNKLWKTLQEVGIPDHLTCLLRNLYVGQEATVRIGHGTTDWFQIGKGEVQEMWWKQV